MERTVNGKNKEQRSAAPLTVTSKRPTPPEDYCIAHPHPCLTLTGFAIKLTSDFVGQRFRELEDSELLEDLCEDGTIGVNSAPVRTTYRLLKGGQGMARPTKMRIQVAYHFQISMPNLPALLWPGAIDRKCPVGNAIVIPLCNAHLL